LSRDLLNEPVVLFRTESGEAVALAGRCPHRHFPLGKGHLVGDSLECGYHGNSLWGRRRGDSYPDAGSDTGGLSRARVPTRRALAVAVDLDG